jgi:addiction module HigA family antidote
MNNISTNQYMPDYCVMPGEILEEHLETLGMSQSDLSRRTGLTPKAINDIVHGKAPISLETAIKLEKVVGHSARFWRKLETNYQEDPKSAR